MTLDRPQTSAYDPERRPDRAVFTPKAHIGRGPRSDRATSVVPRSGIRGENVNSPAKKAILVGLDKASMELAK